jgi:hypothetical protein
LLVGIALLTKRQDHVQELSQDKPNSAHAAEQAFRARATEGTGSNRGVGELRGRDTRKETIGMRALTRLLCLCILLGLAAGCGTTGIDEDERPADFIDMEDTGADFDRFSQ